MPNWLSKKEDIKSGSKNKFSESLHEWLNKKWFWGSEMWAREEIRLINAKKSSKSRQELGSRARAQWERVSKKVEFTESELMDSIDEYFNFCDERLRPYTTSWLALRLGTRRKLIKEFLEREWPYKNAINYAWARCEAFVEDWLYDWSITTVWSIFSLKDWHNWTDKHTLDDKWGGRELTDMSTDEILSQIDDKWFLALN